MDNLDRRTLLSAGLAAATLAPLPAFAAAKGGSPVARTTAGQVRGATDQGVAVFKGVRYGADTGPRRFMAPVAPTPWKGIADATAYGHAAPQRSDQPSQSEDCLFLNVWTPGLRDGAKRPVMVWIHGGAYSNGSGAHPTHDGTLLAKRGDVVVVSLNHRLNAFGYLYLERIAGTAFADSGSAGQLDLILALQWVRDNIAEFGGDPGNVMVFGQSGGGAKIATLMATPAARGLFHKAATMSGQQVTAQGPLNATTRAHALLDALKLKPEQADQLRTVPMAQIVEALNARDPVIGAGGLYMGPVVDRTLPRHPFYPDAAPLSSDIPMIIGNTKGETRGLIGGGDPSTFALTWEQVPPLLARNLRVDIAPEAVVAEYRRLYPAYSPSDVFFAATTAGRSWRGAVIELEERAKGAKAPTWGYQLDFGAQADGGKWGASHGYDIPLVFGTYAGEGSRYADTPETRAASAHMSDAFIAFARTGNPNAKGHPEWRPYGMEKRETMVFDAVSHLESDPRGAERRLFAAVPFAQQGGEISVAPQR